MTANDIRKIPCGRRPVWAVFLLIWTLLPVLPSSAHAFEDDKPNQARQKQYLSLKQDRFHHIIVRVAEQYQVESELVKAMIRVESGYNANAVSRRGAKGLMQLMPDTAEAMGVRDCFDPAQNIDAGVRYFNKLKEQFSGNIVLALAAYNAGPARVRKCGGIPQVGGTRRYIMKVLEFYSAYKQAGRQGAHGPIGRNGHRDRIDFGHLQVDF